MRSPDDRPLARLERTVADLEESIRRARELLPELHAAVKDARNAERDLRRAADDVGPRIDALVDERITGALDRGLDELATSMRKAMDDGADKVAAEFERLGRLFLTGSPDGSGESLETLIRARRGARPRPLVAGASRELAEERERRAREGGGDAGGD